MEKVEFTLDTGETVSFYVLEQTMLGGIQYILVTDVEEGDGEALILKELHSEDVQEESTFEVVEDDEELSAVAAVFENLLEDVELS